MIDFTEIIIPGGKPTATSRDDFGEAADVGLCLRRKDQSYDLPGLIALDAECFGTFDGRCGGEWIVAVQDVLTWETKRYLPYPSLAALKAEWELD